MADPRSGRSTPGKAGGATKAAAASKVRASRTAPGGVQAQIEKDRLTKVFERGPALDVDPTFKKDFSSLGAFAKTELARRAGPFAAQSTDRLAKGRYPLVLVRVVDSSAIAAPNVRLELFDANDTFLDAVVSDGIGLGLLRFPFEPQSAGAPALTGTVRVDATQNVSVTIPAQEDFVVLHVTRTTAAATAEGEVRHDSVLPRLPAFFSINASDEIVRHRATADGPDPCFASAVERQCTYRAPQVRWIYTQRTIFDGKSPPRRLYVRLRQEWHYVGHSFGQPDRIDSRDVATIVGSLDADLAAQLSASGGLDLSTDSSLSAGASGSLRARASLDGELDASAGLRLFSGGLLNPVSVTGDVDVSIDTSLLVSAEIKLRASLRNQLRARASLSGRASLGLEADASIGVNPTLSRELNIPRFVIHQNYVVNSFVEDVQEIEEVPLFGELATTKDVTITIPVPFGEPIVINLTIPTPVFTAADVVEYRPIFERRLLEPALAGRFRGLRDALDNAAGRGPLVRRLRFDVTYAATTTGWFRVTALGRSSTVKLSPDRSQARVAIDLPGGQFLDVLNMEHVDLHVSALPLVAGSVRITSVTAFSDASIRGRDMDIDPRPFEASSSNFTESRDGLELGLPSSDADSLTDPLVVHINRNKTYYMGLLVQAALRNPSLRFDAPQLKQIGPDSVLWRLPIHGFAGNKALVLVPSDAKEAQTLLQDLGRSTVVQIAVDGSWSEAMQGQNALVDALGELFPALQDLELPLELLEGLTAGTGLVPTIVDAAATAGGLAGASSGGSDISGAVLGAVTDVLDV